MFRIPLQLYETAIFYVAMIPQLSGQSIADVVITFSTIQLASKKSIMTLILTHKGLYPKLFQPKTEDESWKNESLSGKGLFRCPDWHRPDLWL